MFPPAAKRLRTPVASALLLFLFAASSLFLSLSAAYRVHVSESIRHTAGQFTPIAIANDAVLVHDAFPDGNYDFFNKNGKLSLKQKYLALRHFVDTSEHAVLDSREILRGVARDVWPVLTRYFSPGETVKDMPYNTSLVLAATCVGTSLLGEEDMQPYGKRGYGLNYKADFSVDKEIVVHPDYAGKESMSLIGNRFTENREIPFEVGKKYILFVEYVDVYKIKNPAFWEQGDYSAPMYMLDPDAEPYLFPNETLLLKDPDAAMGLEEYLALYPSPQITEVTYKGNKYTVLAYPENQLRSFRWELTTDLETFWKEHPILEKWKTSVFEANMHSLYVLTTDSLVSLPLLNQHKAWIKEGRGFTEEELAGEVPACIISETLAAYNRLSIGDTLELSLWELLVQRDGSYAMSDYSGAAVRRTHRGDVAPVIVGIFSAPKEPFGSSVHGLSVNTVILPAKAVPNPGNREPLPPSFESLFEYPPQWDANGNIIANPSENPDNYVRYNLVFNEDYYTFPDLFAAIITPNQLDAFKQEAKAAGLDRYFLYSDQGFSSLKEPLKRLKESADTFLLLSATVWAALLAVLVILSRRERHELGLLLTVGVKRGRAAANMAAGWLALLLPALVLSGVLATVCFGAFSQAVLGNVMAGEEFTQTFSVGLTADKTTAAELVAEAFRNQSPAAGIWLCTLVQAAVYAAVLGLVFALLSRGKPAKLLKKRE